MITKYLASRWSEDIEKYEYVRETAGYLFDESGIRTKKNSFGTDFFDTWEDARKCLESNAVHTLKAAERGFERASKRLRDVQKMKEPEDTK